MERYNLRSGKRECHIPVQLQLAGDEDFLTGSLEASGQAGQVSDSDQSDISGSDIDISTLLNTSEQNSPISSPVKGKTHTTKSGQMSQGLGEGGSSDHVTQNDINHIILSQLTALGERLANIENNHRVPKKTSDSSKIKSSNKVAKKVKTAVTHRGLAHDLAPSSAVLKHDLPPPDKLREEARIQLEVQNRLKQLAEQAKPGNEKIKSQRGGSVEVFVKNRVKWPHEFVLSGQNKDRLSYNQLSPIQWVAGFCRTMREESSIQNREYMLDYVINLLEDATDFSWASAKASHAVLLCRMEQGEITSWAETEKIDRVRRAHAQRHTSASYGGSRNVEKTHGSGKTAPCLYYNKGSCMQKQSHETKGTFYKHICSYCWQKESKAFPHTQIECKKLASKNE